MTESGVGSFSRIKQSKRQYLSTWTMSKLMNNVSTIVDTQKTTLRHLTDTVKKNNEDKLFNANTIYFFAH